MPRERRAPYKNETRRLRDLAEPVKYSVNATATGVQTRQEIPGAASKFALQVVLDGAVTDWQVDLDVGLNSGGHTTILTHDKNGTPAQVDGETVWVTDKLVSAFRINVVTLTGGTGLNIYVLAMS